MFNSHSYSMFIKMYFVHIQHALPTYITLYNHIATTTVIQSQTQCYFAYITDAKQLLLIPTAGGQKCGQNVSLTTAYVPFVCSQ